MERAPGPSKSFVRGKSGYVPFWPGGLDDIFVDTDEGEKSDARHGSLRTVPPGFLRGLQLPGDENQEEGLAALDEVPITSRRQDDEMVSCSRLHEANDLTHNQHDVSSDNHNNFGLSLAGKESELDDLLPTTVRYSSIMCL